MKHDDAEYFFLNFETDKLENEAGATHIGMYMAWMILHELVSEELRAHAAERIAALKAREITGPEFVVDQLDCKLMDGDLSEQGNAFTLDYYPKQFPLDYMEAFGVDDSTADVFCSVPDTWDNFAKIGKVIDVRFEVWKRARRR